MELSLAEAGIVTTHRESSAVLSDPTPEELLARFAGGDSEAFVRLVDQLGERLFGFIRRFIGDPHDAEDVYQTVLIQVARHAKQFDGRSRLCTWLYRIARNACVDALRKMARDRETPWSGTGGAGDDAPLENMAGDVPPPDVQVTQEELAARIADAIERLPAEQREIFLLKEDADLTFDEIGALLGCGRETAKSRMRYALKRLQSALGREARLYGLTPAAEALPPGSHSSSS